MCTVTKVAEAFALVTVPIEMIIGIICPKIWSKIPHKNEKNPLPVDTRRSKRVCLSSLTYVASLPFLRS